MAFLVVVPTYNEKDNLDRLIDGVLRHDAARLLGARYARGMCLAQWT